MEKAPLVYMPEWPHARAEEIPQSVKHFPYKDEEFDPQNPSGKPAQERKKWEILGLTVQPA